VGSGGVFGTGAGQGSQITMGFLPAAQSDFIFASLVEEWGMIGGVVVIGLFVYLIWQIASVALKAENNFARIFVSGVALLFFVQMFINIGMNIGILPITGIPLPFFSYGGSNLVTTFALLGLVESVAMRRSLG
jgi:rod shape determining protein RodA